MMFQWTEDMIRFMKDASEYGTYHARLTEQMRPYLAGHVCDAGCGLGYLSVAMAPYARMVTAVDIKPAALQVLRETVQQRGIRNIRTECGDIAALPPQTPYDTMVFCMFGKPDEVLALAAAQCRGKAILLQSAEKKHGFSVDGIAREHPDGIEEILQKKGIPYIQQDFSVEFGQPFRSKADALLFFQTYGRKETVTFAMIEDRLRETGEEAYPYYLPRLKKMRMLVLDAAAIEGEQE